MKCVKNVKGKVTRVANLLAEELVKSGKHVYCGKAEWKKLTRKKVSTKAPVSV